ncbi:MAG: hypothetical protein ABI295_02355 [Xanthomarina sp.]
MKIFELFHGLIEKFVPMDKTTTSELQTEAIIFYNTALDEAKELEKKNLEIHAYNLAHQSDEEFQPKRLLTLSLKSRIIGILNAWYVRYIIAILFIYLVPKIKNYMNASMLMSDRDDNDDYDDLDDFDPNGENEEAELFEQFLEFKRRNN